MVLVKSSVADESSTDAAERLGTAFAGAQPVASAVAVKNASEGIQADLRLLLEDENVGAAFTDSLIGPVTSQSLHRGQPPPSVSKTMDCLMFFDRGWTYLSGVVVPR